MRIYNQKNSISSDMRGMVVRMAITLGLGCQLCACVNGVNTHTQEQGKVVDRHTVVLSEPLYVETRMRLMEITQLTTSSAATVGSHAEFWAVKTQRNGINTPIAPVSHGVKIEGVSNGEAIAIVDGRRVPISANEQVNVEICSTASAGIICNTVASVSGRVLADGRGEIEAPAYGQLDYQVSSLIENESFKNPSHIAAAVTHMQRVVLEDNEARAQAAAQAPERARLARQREEEHRISAFKKPNVGSVQFCESVMLLSPGYPVNSATLFSCEQGKATLGELRAYGWEVTSMSRRPDTDSIGRRADDISIAMKKIRTGN